MTKNQFDFSFYLFSNVYANLKIVIQSLNGRLSIHSKLSVNQPNIYTYVTDYWAWILRKKIKVFTYTI